MKLPLEKARICLECDTIHDLPACPECGSDTYYFLANWVKPQHPPKPRPDSSELKLELPPPKKKKRHLVRNALVLGAGLIAAYQFWFSPSRKKPPSD